MRPHPGDSTRLVARRAFFLIDRQGIVRGRWLAADGDVVASDTILRAVEAIGDGR